MIDPAASSTIRIAEAFAKAKAMLAQVFDQTDLAAVICKPSRDTEFVAEVSCIKDGFVIEISAGVVAALDQAWADVSAMPDVDFVSEITAKECTDESLTWLCLHELMHVVLDHLSYSPHARLVEIGDSSPAITTPALALCDSELSGLRKCLELQADSDATDIFLGLYDRHRWGSLHRDARAAFLVMALIERLNQDRGDKNSSHPLAATRFFLLLAHLFQMWSFPGAHLEPTDDGTKVRPAGPLKADEFEAYANAVLAPLVNDAINIAAAIGAETFLDDMGGAGALFLDIHAVQFASPLRDSDLRTNAAKEWLRLNPLNEKLMIAAGYRE